MFDDRWLWLYAAFIVAAIVFSVVPAADVAHMGAACNGPSPYTSC